jgi:hypothetical protein
MKLGSITTIPSQSAKVWNGGTKAHCPLEISRHHFNQHGNSFLGS